MVGDAYYILEVMESILVLDIDPTEILSRCRFLYLFGSTHAEIFINFKRKGLWGIHDSSYLFPHYFRRCAMRRILIRVLNSKLYAITFVSNLIFSKNKTRRYYRRTRI